MIPTLPLRARNRLATTILAALHDACARQRLAGVAGGDVAEVEWLGAEGQGAGVLLRQRAESATRALAALPLGVAAPPLTEALVSAAVLFDAGLAFEVHELLEPYWVRADGEEREALQGLIQIAVGYQHLANGNLAGARALLDEGTTRIRGRNLAGIDCDAFARAARATIPRLTEGPTAPDFPRRRTS